MGAITAAGMNQFPNDIVSSQYMAEWLIKLWGDIRRTDVYTTWTPGGLMQGLLYEKGLFNNTPLFNFLNSHLTEPPQRWLNIGATNIQTAELVRFNETLSKEETVQAVLCSASVPGIFPWQKF